MSVGRMLFVCQHTYPSTRITDGKEGRLSVITQRDFEPTNAALCFSAFVPPCAILLRLGLVLCECCFQVEVENSFH